MSFSHHRPLRLGTRGSPLALAQAGRIARQLRERCGRSAVLVPVVTPGDESTAPIERLGTTGVFTTTLREALLRGDVDLVVHSCKDLPTAPVPGLSVAAFPAREDPRDALIWPGGTSLDALPHGVRIGTGSPRRAALLRATGRQLQIVPMRGNVGTRLRKLADGEVDALVLAMAGLSRLGLLDAVATPLHPSLLMPAPAQGVLAVECRTDDPVAAAQIRTLDHAPTRAAAITERGFLAALDTGCSAPVGALAELAAEAGAEPAVRLSGLIAAADGSSVIRAQTTGVVGDGDALGRRLAHTLLQDGGAALLDHTSDRITDPRPAQAHPWTSRFHSPTDRGFASRGRIPASCNAAAPHPCHHDRMPLRCLLIDDSDAFLEAASGLLQREGVTVVGVASNTAEALRQARALRPDVILVDIGLGDESGFDLARLLARDGQGGSAEVIMISARPETDYTELIAESPATGFLAKSELSVQGIGRLLGHAP